MRINLAATRPDGADVERELRHTGDRGGLAHVDSDADHVAGIERVAIDTGSRTEYDAADAGCVVVHQIASVGSHGVMGQRGGIAGAVGERAAVEREAVAGDADTVGVGVAALDGVVENQRRAAGTGSVAGLDRAATDVERQLWCAARGIHHGVVVHRDGDTEHITRVQIAADLANSRTDGHAGDGRRRGVHLVGAVVARRGVGECGGVAGSVCDRGAAG